MFATKEDQRLYLPAWEYNAARVLGCVAEIVTGMGGDVKPWKHIMANNRQYEPDAEPRQIYGQSWIVFVLDGVYYNFSWDDNPYFEETVHKTWVVNGRRLRNVYADSPLPPWKSDCLFRIASDLQCRCIAEELLENMRRAPMSGVYRERKRISVPNTYDGKSHCETMVEPDKWIPVFNLATENY